MVTILRHFWSQFAPFFELLGSLSEASWEKLPRGSFLVAVHAPSRWAAQKWDEIGIEKPKDF